MKKNMKNTHGGVLLLLACNFTKSDTPPRVLFTCKCYQIVQNIANYICFLLTCNSSLSSYVSVYRYKLCLQECLKYYSMQYLEELIAINIHKQPLRGVLGKKCSENMQQTQRRAPLLKCDLQLHLNHTSARVLPCKCFAYFQSTFS